MHMTANDSVRVFTFRWTSQVSFGDYVNNFGCASTEYRISYSKCFRCGYGNRVPEGGSSLYLYTSLIWNCAEKRMTNTVGRFFGMMFCGMGGF